MYVYWTGFVICISYFICTSIFRVGLVFESDNYYFPSYSTQLDRRSGTYVKNTSVNIERMFFSLNWDSVLWKSKWLLKITYKGKVNRDPTLCRCTLLHARRVQTFYVKYKVEDTKDPITVNCLREMVGTLTQRNRHFTPISLLVRNRWNEQTISYLINTYTFEKHSTFRYKSVSNHFPLLE